MAKLTLNDIENLDGNPSSAETNINANSAAIEAALENTLSRDGTTPNTMSADLDMNSQKVTNVASPASGGDATNKTYVDGLIGSGGGGHWVKIGNDIYYTGGNVSIGRSDFDTMPAGTTLLQLGGDNGISFNAAAGGGWVDVLQNAYWNGSGYTLIGDGPSSGYELYNGGIFVRTKVAGVAGDTFSYIDSFNVDVNGNVTVGNVLATTGSVGVFHIANATTAPTGTPNTGVDLWSVGADLWFKGTSSSAVKVIDSTGAINVVTATTTQLADVTDAINTDARKIAGFQVFNTATSKPLWAVGNTDGAVWVDATGTTAINPV